MIRKILVLLLLSLASLLGAGQWQLDKLLKQPLQFAGDRTWTVRSGQGVISTLNQLEKEGVIKGSKWLSLYYRLQPPMNLKQGDYVISDDITDVPQLLALFEQGQVIMQSITFVEGQTVAQFRAQLAGLDDVEHMTTEWTDEQLLQALEVHIRI